MSDKPKIRIELENALQIKTPEIMSLVDTELDLMDITDGLDEGRTNLQSFHRIWKDHQGQVGTKNEINSWTAYALGMTTVKPTGDFLPARRAFARKGFPDIDTDFDDERRQEVYDYLIEKWGRENVGNIGTFQAQKMKAAIKNVTKAVDAAYAFHKGDKECTTLNDNLAQQISDTLPVLPTGVIRWRDSNGKEIIIKKLFTAKPDEKDGIYKDAYHNIPEFKRYMDQYPDVLRHASSIEGLAGAFSQHAAGVVISNVPLRTISPMRRSKKGLATQFVYEDLEALGLIKFDILAIASLTVIRDATEMIESNYGIKLDMENLRLDDAKTLALYRSGDLNGVFQCENYGMQDTMRQIGVDRFDDVMAAIALYRPGPMDSIPEYVARKKGSKRVDYFHPSIEKYVKEILSRSYGVLVYQEQVMAICNILAGFTLSEGYVMIKAVGKKKQYLLDKYKKLFIKGCVANGVPKEVAEQYWDKFITPFANYGFNAAHSCCYAYLSYQTAFLKANYPDEFSCAFLNTHMRRSVFKSASSWKQVYMMERDAQKTSKVKLLSRSLSECDVQYKIFRKKDPSKGIVQTEIRPGMCCKGLGYESAKNIVERGPYEHENGKLEAFLIELAEKTDPDKLNKEGVAALVDAGFFRGKEGIKKREEIIKKFDDIRKGLKKTNAKGIKSQEIKF
jgi:DNA-directed DNA polymerase III PolC